MDSKKSIIRTIYLYLFTLVGLFLIVIGSVQFLNMGLKAFVFTKADQEMRMHYKQPPMPMCSGEYESHGDVVGSVKLTVDEEKQVDMWLAEYKAWQEEKDTVDPVTADRHRDASINLAMMIVGLPLYLYHWRTIKKDQGKV